LIDSERLALGPLARLRVQAVVSLVMVHSPPCLSSRPVDACDAPWAETWDTRRSWLCDFILYTLSLKSTSK